MHELMASLFLMHQSLTTTRFCREIRQNAMIRIDIEKLLGYMYVVDLTSSGNCSSADFYFCLISLYLQVVGRRPFGPPPRLAASCIVSYQ